MREKKQSEKNQRDAQTRNQEEKKQEKNFQKNHIPKITVLLFVVAVLLVILIGKQSWNEYRDSIIDNQKKQLLLTVQGLCDSMEEFMASCQRKTGIRKRTGMECRIKKLRIGVV